MRSRFVLGRRVGDISASDLSSAPFHKYRDIALRAMSLWAYGRIFSREVPRDPRFVRESGAAAPILDNPLRWVACGSASCLARKPLVHTLQYL